jgi:hypothetical protein
MELIEQLSLLAAEHFKATSALLREGGDTRLLLGRAKVLQVRWENVAEELEEDIKGTLLLRQPRAKLGQRLWRKDAIAAEVYVRPGPGAHSSVLIFESIRYLRDHILARLTSLAGGVLPFRKSARTRLQSARPHQLEKRCGPIRDLRPRGAERTDGDPACWD